MSGSGILKYKSNVPTTKRDSNDIQKQYTTFEFNPKFIKSYERIAVSDNEKQNYNSQQLKKKEIRPHSFDELYSDIYFYKNNIIVIF